MYSFYIHGSVYLMRGKTIIKKIETTERTKIGADMSNRNLISGRTLPQGGIARYLKTLALGKRR